MNNKLYPITHMYTQYHSIVYMYGIQYSISNMTSYNIKYEDMDMGYTMYIVHACQLPLLLFKIHILYLC